MKNVYVMTEVQIEALASERTNSLLGAETMAGTYLRALVTGSQSKLGPKRGKTPTEETQLAALEAVAVPFYAAVLRGVTTDEIAIDATVEHAEAVTRNRERNRRATFARTAKSTLVAWVKAGGDLRAIDVATVTKGELRASTAAATGGLLGVPPETRLQRAQRAILAAVAREGPDVARAHLEGVIAALQEALDELPEVDAGESTVIRTRAGAPTFREPARVLNRGA
jgi:hypothetical protein